MTIRHVFFLVADVKMAWIYTTTNVAAMKYTHSIRNVSIGRDVRDPMRFYRLAT